MTVQSTIKCLSIKCLSLLALLSLFYLANLYSSPTYLAAQQPDNPGFQCQSWAVVSLHHHQTPAADQSLHHWCLLVLGQLHTSSQTSQNYFS